MTFAELGTCYEGVARRQKDEEQRDAFLLVNLIQPHVKDRLKMIDFMPRARQEQADLTARLIEDGTLRPDEVP